jgi:hypothetical protein
MVRPAVRVGLYMVPQAAKSASCSDTVSSASPGIVRGFFIRGSGLVRLLGFRSATSRPKRIRLNLGALCADICQLGGLKKGTNQCHVEPFFRLLQQ